MKCDWLFVVEQSAQIGAQAREGMDLVLAALCFDAAVVILFRAEGLDQLDRNGAELADQDWLQAWPSVLEHGALAVCVPADDWATRPGLASSMPVQVLDAASELALWRRAARVVRL